MKKLLLTLSVLCSLNSLSDVHALDSQCEPILKAGELRSKLPAWQSVIVINKSMKMEYIKADGKHFMRRDNEKWTTMPGNVDEVERKFSEQVRSGEFKLTQCKSEPSAPIDGVDVVTINYTLEMPGAPAVQAKLQIGKADGLPYAQYSDKTETHYRYKDVKAPS